MQMMSDLHLEFLTTGGLPEFEVKAPILALLGDIGNPRMLNYRRFLWFQADRFEHVFVLAGNHEHYLCTPAAMSRIICKICSKKTNIHFLNNSSFDLAPNLRVLGSTLWAEPKEEHWPMLTKYMTDYSQI